MKASGYILSFLLLVVALPAAAQVNDTYVIPVVANTSGGFSTRWMTQLSIFNPQRYTLRVSLTWIPSGGGQAEEVLIDVPANSVQLTDNALLEIYHSSGSGAFLAATFPEDNPSVPDNVLARSFLVTTSTFNKLSDGGTFGQTIPGVWTGLEDDGISAVAHGIRDLDQYGWRTNFGAVNLGNTKVQLLVTVYDADGNSLVSDRPYDIPAQAHMQWRLPVQVDRGSVEFYLNDPTGKAVVFPYTSTLDRYTGDPMYQTPLLLARAVDLYFKMGEHPDPTAVGRKLTIEDARQLRSSASRLGEMTLSRAMPK